MIDIGSILLSVGLLLAVIGVRLWMVRHSLEAGKPNSERLKSLRAEFMILVIAGFLIFLIGFFSPYLTLSVERAKIIASSGGMIFGLAIPQYVQYYYGIPTVGKYKGIRFINIWIAITLSPGIFLIFISGFIFTQ
jgi:hypothetical protein